MRALDKEVERLDQRIGELKGPITEYEVRKNKLGDDLAVAREEHSTEIIKREESRARLPVGILDSEIDERLKQALAAAGTWRTKREMAEKTQAGWQSLATQSHEQRGIERVRLTQPAHEAEYSDFDASDEGNERYDARLDELNKHKLPEFEQLAIDRRAEWERRLQEDVLDKLRERLEEATRTVSDFRRVLGSDIGNYRYTLTQRRDPAHRVMWKLLDESQNGLMPGDELLDYKLRGEIEAAKRELMQAIDNPDDKRAASLLDYRTYHRYDLEMIPSGHSEDSEGRISLQDSVKKFSGGEGQAPFFVAMLAAFHRVYDLGQRGNQANLGLVVMDEAFSKLSAGHIADCLALAENFGLQLILAFPMDRLGTMIHHADSIIQCRMEKQHNERGVPVEIINDVIYWERQRMIDEILS